ncbi:MAG: twin-arginine translocase subunit TatC [Deltaproteobacteria bacterium]|nr:twin-arginine translocase subunit TatC [Deltaproteobacteria bacterium]
MAAAKTPPDVEDVPATELETSRMPFLSHLRELRDRVRNAAICFVLAFVVCFLFNEEIFNWLEQPMRNAWDTKKMGDFHVVYTTLTEPFWVGMSIALWAGIFVASPFIFYQLWRFIAPGLYKKEQRITVAFAGFSAVFFVGGALFCYFFVLPNLYEFLLSYSEKDQQAMIAMQGYLDLTRDMMLAFGAVFELPLLITFLSMVGMVTHRGLWKFNRWFVVIAFIVGAILTPSPDVVSQIMMAGPMIALYNVSIILSWRVTLRREARESILKEQERIADEKELAERKARRARGERVDDDDDEE